MCGGDAEVAAYVERVLVQSVDARDNGQKLAIPASRIAGDEDAIGQVPAYDNVMPFEFADAIGSFNFCWDETARHPDAGFCDAVRFASAVLSRLIERARSIGRAGLMAREAIARSEGMRLVVLSRAFPWQAVVVNEAPSILFMVSPEAGGRWRVETVPTRIGTYQYRMLLPVAWEDLDQQTFITMAGVPDAFFVHRKRFICVAGSLEGALTLAKLALEA